MDSLFDRIIDHFGAEWSVIAHAPVAVLLLAAGIGLVLYFLLYKHFEARIETGEKHIGLKDSHISFLDQQLNEYKAKLSGATPDQAAAEIENLKNDLRNTKAQMDMITKWYLYQTAERHLTDEQHAIIGRRLETLPQQCKTHIQISSVQDSEAVLFGMDILKVFHEHGICTHQKGPHMMHVSTQDETGVLIVVRDEHNPPPHATTILDALKSAGVEADLDTLDSDPIDPDFCAIFVGPKPPIKA